MLNAYLCSNPKPTPSTLLFAISCPELDIELTHKNPTNELCRQIMNVSPERGQECLKVYRGEKLQYTIRNISDWAGKSNIETDKQGIRTVPFKKRSYE